MEKVHNHLFNIYIHHLFNTYTFKYHKYRSLIKNLTDQHIFFYIYIIKHRIFWNNKKMEF